MLSTAGYSLDESKFLGRNRLPTNIMLLLRRNDTFLIETPELWSTGVTVTCSVAGTPGSLPVCAVTALLRSKAVSNDIKCFMLLIIIGLCMFLLWFGAWLLRMPSFFRSKYSVLLMGGT